MNTDKTKEVCFVWIGVHRRSSAAHNLLFTLLGLSILKWETWQR
jgi:hypothetical protein